MKTQIFLLFSLINKIPALEGKSSSELIGHHLNAMHTVHKLFIEAKSHKKLIRAIKAKTTNSTGHIYQPGDTVYFKREHSNSWKGPGTGFGLENKYILVKHGGTCFRVDACCFQHAKEN